VNISVPASESTEQALQDVGQIVINVRADGTLVVLQEVLTEQQLFAKLVNIASVNIKQAIVIRGDVKSSYEHIFKVLDNCRKAGLYHVSFASQSPPN
jgi:biopolymer transport protein ExbD